MSATSGEQGVENDDVGVEPACPVRNQCDGKSYADGEARHFAGFFDPCSNDECFPDADAPDDVEPDEYVVVGRGRGMSRMHRPRE